MLHPECVIGGECPPKSNEMFYRYPVGLKGTLEENIARCEMEYLIGDDV